MAQDSDRLQQLHLASTVDLVTEALVCFDSRQHITSWNKGAERLLGYRSTEVIGQPLAFLTAAGREAEHDRLWADVTTGSGVKRLRSFWKRRSGRIVPVSIRGVALAADGGPVAGASFVVRGFPDDDQDFAARRLAAIVSSSDDAIVSKDLNGIITSWNAGAERLFGYSAAEAIGQSIRMLIPDGLQGEEDNVLRTIHAGGVVDHYETTRRRKDGDLINVSLTVSPIRDDEGEIIGASKIARDVTEAVRLRTTIEQTAERADKLHEVGTVVASSLERDVIVQKVTDVATELTEAEFGAFFYNVVDQQNRGAYMLYTLSGAPIEAFKQFPHPRATAVFGPTFDGEGPVRMDDVTRDARFGQNPPYYGMPPGHLPVRSYLAVPVKARSGEVLGGLFFGHSSSGIFTAQHERLAEGVAAWAAVALENARLYVDARDANRMKDEFLAVLSHELRTPLNAIVGYARLLRGGLLNGEKAASAFETIDRNAAWLTQIIEDVLDVSRIVSGKLRLDVEPVQLPLVLRDAVLTVQPAADARGVRLQTILDPSLPAIAGDRDRLQQVFWNLLSNAVKFTPRGGRVQIRLERVNSHVELIVSDTGIGIQPDFLPYVFERFRQEDSGIARKAGGLGLGLAIVRHIIEMHGGTVHATSGGQDQGSTFRVKLPVMIVHPGVEEPRHHPQVERLRALQRLSGLEGLRVLAVDDEPDALALLQAVLETAGAEVRTCASGPEALLQVTLFAPQVLILDLGMPQMDGFSVLRAVRALTDERAAATPTVALTAFARSEDRTRALRAGFQMHLAKPVDPEELVASVAALAGGSRERKGT